MATDILTSSQAGRAAALTVSTHSLTIAAAVPSSQHVADAFQHRIHRPPRLFGLEDRPRHSVGREHIAARRLPYAHVSLQIQVFETVKRRLQCSGILIGDLDERFFAFLLPTNSASSTDWSLLIEDPIFVSNDKLRTMLSMERCTADTPRATGTIVYVRTFTFTFAQLSDVLEQIVASFPKHARRANMFMERVVQSLNDHNDANTAIYIRYCGTTGSETAWKRHARDLKVSDKGTTFVADFLHTCQRRHPGIVAAVEVDMLPKGAINLPLDYHQQHIADFREQALIALFGLDTLLNTSSGGYNLNIVPVPIDELEFLQLRTRTFTFFSRYARPCTPTTREAIRTYAATCQRYTKQHPVTTKSQTSPMNSTMTALLAEQGMPSMLTTLSGRYSVMLSIGSDVPPQCFTSRKSFYAGGVSSARIIMEMFDNYAFGELGYRSTSERPVQQLQRHGHLPFVDLYPWAAKDTRDLGPALEMLRNYLQVTQPIILLTFGNMVSQEALGCFQHDNRLRDERLIQNVGGVFTSKYDDDGAASTDDNCCLVIPCIHPGAVARNGNENASRLRLIDKTLAKVWLATSLAFEITQTGTEWHGSKRDLCQRIRKSIDAKCGQDTPFGKSFEEAREQYCEAISDRNSRSAMTVRHRLVPGVMQGDIQKPKAGPKPLTPSLMATQDSARLGIVLKASKAATTSLGSFQQAQNSSTGRLPLERPSIQIAEIPALFFKGRQEPFQMGNTGVRSKEARLNALKAQLPFRPGDAGWLFHKFLEEYYPNGGTMYLFHHQQGDGKLRKLPSMWTYVASFLSKPVYRRHPHYNALQALLETSRDNTRNNKGYSVTKGLTKIVNVLRPPVTSRLLEDKMGTVRRSITTLEIGATVPSNTIVGDGFAQDVDEALRQSLASQRRAQIRPSSSIDQGRKRVAEDQGQGKQDEQGSKRVKVAGNDRRRWIDDEDDEEMLV